MKNKIIPLEIVQEHYHNLKIKFRATNDSGAKRVLLKRLINLAGVIQFLISISNMNVQVCTLTGNHQFNQNVPFTVKGGYDASFNACVGYTTINGIVTIGMGSLTVDHLIIE